jgi:hypothetical protein
VSSGVEWRQRGAAAPVAGAARAGRMSCGIEDAIDIGGVDEEVVKVKEHLDH